VDRAQSVGDGRSGAVLPDANDVDDQTEAEDQDGERHDPRSAVKAAGGGSGEDGRSVFLHEGLLDEAVAVAAADGGHEFVAHAVGVGAADVVALEQDLVASADAHELMAEFVEAGGGVSGAGESGDSEGEQSAVESAAGWSGSRHDEQQLSWIVPQRLKPRIKVG